MYETKRKRLEAKGWHLGSAKEFLALSDQESAYIELKLRLAETLREKRRQRHLGQTDLAKLVRSSQSRVAKMEAANGSVSLDLLIRSLIALGTTHPELGRIIARYAPRPPKRPSYRRARSSLAKVKVGRYENRFKNSPADSK